MVILNLYGMPFHAVVVFRLEQDFLFKSTSTYCAALGLNFGILILNHNLLLYMKEYVIFILTSI